MFEYTFKCNKCKQAYCTFVLHTTKPASSEQLHNELVDLNEQHCGDWELVE